MHDVHVHLVSDAELLDEVSIRSRVELIHDAVNDRTHMRIDVDAYYKVDQTDRCAAAGDRRFLARVIS